MTTASHARRRSAPGRARSGARPGSAAADPLAGAVAVPRPGVGDDVAAVEERAVEALPAQHAVDLAVAGVDAVVAGVAERGVGAAAQADHVGAAVAVLAVVSPPGEEQVAPVLAERG